MTALTEASFEPVVMYVQQSTRRMLSWDIFSEHPAKSVMEKRDQLEQFFLQLRFLKLYALMLNYLNSWLCVDWRQYLWSKCGENSVVAQQPG
jgi:hypothetical protein